MDENAKSESRRYNRLIAEIDEVYHEVALRQGYSDSIMAILAVLADQDGSCLLTELIRQSGINKQTINSALRKLEKEELLYLEPAGGKAKRVCLTEKGKVTVHETVEKVIAVENKIYRSWSGEEWETYIRLTQKYLDQLREEMKEI